MQKEKVFDVIVKKCSRLCHIFNFSCFSLYDYTFIL